MPGTPLGMQDREPLPVGRIESSRCNASKCSGFRFASIFLIHIEQDVDTWLDNVGGLVARPSQHLRQLRPNHRESARSEAWNRRKATIVSGNFERFKRIDVQRVHDKPSEFRPYTRHAGKQRFRVESAPQSFQLHPTTGSKHFDNRAADLRADPLRSQKPPESLFLEDDGKLATQRLDDVCSLSIRINAIGISALLLEKPCCFAKTLCNRVIVHLSLRVTTPL